MNTRRIIFWASFIIILALIIWGMVVAMNKPPREKVDSPAPISSTDHVIGNPDAKVTLIEYSDFQCPACGAYYPIVSRLITEASTTLRFAYRHFPLPQHPNAMPSAIASEAAANQGKFYEMVDLIFTNQADWTELPNAIPVFVGYATKLGLDMEKFNADMLATSTQARVEAQNAEGVRIGINATPTFFVNGKIIDNPRSYEQFKAIIDAAATSTTE